MTQLVAIVDGDVATPRRHHIAAAQLAHDPDGCLQCRMGHLRELAVGHGNRGAELFGQTQQRAGDAAVHGIVRAAHRFGHVPNA